ncbi:hypothetical protein SDC9_176630 [bioreactor metagenome]|uniref:Uncharacterized protein n=1 Tax=bioreactor metagenome TaxID=1076179 RepID=A0A645GTL9_9ZZZZ
MSRVGLSVAVRGHLLHFRPRYAPAVGDVLSRHAHRHIRSGILPVELFVGVLHVRVHVHAGHDLDPACDYHVHLPRDYRVCGGGYGLQP